MNQRLYRSSFGCHVVPPASARHVREAGDVTDLVAFIDRGKVNAVSGSLALRRRLRVILKSVVLMLLVAMAAIAAAMAWLPA